MARFRTEIVVAVCGAVFGAIAGALVTWSVGATIVVAGWLLALLVAFTIAALVFAAVVARRLVLMKALVFDTTKRVYFATSKNAINPGPFCPKCYEVDGKTVSVSRESDGTHFCGTCMQIIYPDD